jgi:hypothetical protein
MPARKAPMSANAGVHCLNTRANSAIIPMLKLHLTRLQVLFHMRGDAVHGAGAPNGR